MARKLKLINFRVVSVDGTKLDADTGINRSAHYALASESVEQHRFDV